MRVELGVFAHDEEPRIGAMLGDLLAQSVFDAPAPPRIHVLCNGCRDGTAAAARAALPPGHAVHDLAAPGKSRTWNAFVHDLSAPDAGLLIFADADIRLPDRGTLAALIGFMAAHPEIRASSSAPKKDIGHDRPPRGVTERLIAAGAGSLGDDASAICGQLYIARADAVRRFHLPAGLPVEDGFVRAMILSDGWREPGRVARIAAGHTAFHVYASETTPAGLFRHQLRLVVGGAVNAAVFGWLNRTPPERARTALAAAATDEAWLRARLDEMLPRAPDGWVPVHFLVKRLGGLARAGWRRWPAILAGVALDAAVYVAAQIRMSRGRGAGFW